MPEFTIHQFSRQMPSKLRRHPRESEKGAVRCGRRASFSTRGQCGRLARFACLTTTISKHQRHDLASFLWSRCRNSPFFPSNSINSHQRHPDLTRFFFETEMLQIFPVCMIIWPSKGMFTPYGHFSLKILEFIFTRDISV